MYLVPLLYIWGKNRNGDPGLRDLCLVLIGGCPIEVQILRFMSKHALRSSKVPKKTKLFRVVIDSRENQQGK